MISKSTLFLTIVVLFFSLTVLGQTVVINEINYNSAPTADTEDWVEIYNRSDVTINISGWVLKDSNDDNQFVIPGNTFLAAGAYLVIYRDEMDFDAVHTNVNNKVGPIDFNFSNGGELIRLFNASSVLIDQVQYDDEGDWPTGPDGNGPTLELKNPDLNNDLASSWTTSSGNGTPGRLNSILTNNETDEDSPSRFSLSQNYPNPFNPSTSISYSISKPGIVILEVFDVLGNKVADLVNEFQISGTHEVVFEASDIPSGVYMYRLSTDGKHTIRRMTLIK